MNPEATYDQSRQPDPGRKQMELPVLLAEVTCSILRNRRIEIGLSQEQLATRSNLARSYVCDVERGARHPSLRNLSIISGALDIRTSTVIEQAELTLASRVDMDQVRSGVRKGLHGELMEYFSDHSSDGFIVADQSGQFLVFNEAANRITGVGRIDSDPADWPDLYGCFLPDRVTKYATRQLPLIRAIEGESVDGAEIFLVNHAAPQGKWLKLNGRPILDARGRVQGGLILFKEIANR